MLFASKLRRMITYQEGLPPIKSQHPLFMWSSEIVWQTKTIIAPLPQCLRPQTWLDDNLPWGPSIHKVTCPINYIFLLDHMRNVRCISFNLIHKVIKLGRVVTYNEELQLIKSHNFPIRQLFEVTWQIEYFISPHAPDQLQWNMAKWWFTIRRFYVFTWSCAAN